MGYGDKKNQGFSSRKFTIFLLFVSIIWLFLSMIADRSPLRTVTAMGELFSNSPDPISHYSRDLLLKEVAKRDRSIDSLKLVIEDFSIIREKDQAIVMIESDKLNVRESPDIKSAVLFRIPDSTLVNILMFDTEPYVIDGKTGNWCKVEYESEQGWVWGNYLKKVNATN